jgi:hypothetical protein
MTAGTDRVDLRPVLRELREVSALTLPPDHPRHLAAIAAKEQAVAACEAYEAAHSPP